MASRPPLFRVEATSVIAAALGALGLLDRPVATNCNELDGPWVSGREGAAAVYQFEGQFFTVMNPVTPWSPEKQTMVVFPEAWREKIEHAIEQEWASRKSAKEFGAR